MNPEGKKVHCIADPVKVLNSQKAAVIYDPSPFGTASVMSLASLTNNTDLGMISSDINHTTSSSKSQKRN
jgi:hypothetical protein